MKGLVWALYLMVQDPSAAAVAGGQAQMGHSWAYTGVSYLNRASCTSDAATFSKMPARDKSDSADRELKIVYVCVLQPMPGHYKG